jgi:hypothetical protein
MSRPPSQAVIEAVEQAERDHYTRWFEWSGEIAIASSGELRMLCGSDEGWHD